MTNVSLAGEVSQEMVDRNPWGEWSPLRDVSTWIPPKIRFVEALKDPHKWTVPPLER